MRSVHSRFGGLITLALGAAAGLVFAACSGDDFSAHSDSSGGSGGLSAGNGGKSGGSGGGMSKGGRGGNGGSMSAGGSEDGGEGGGNGGTDMGGNGGTNGGGEGGSGGTDTGGNGGTDVGGGSGNGGVGGNPVGGSAGAAGLGGTAGLGGSAGLGGTAGFGGSAGLGGTAGFGGSAGKGGSSGSGGCNQTVWFQDSDHDDFGRNSSKMLGCQPPGDTWGPVGGDCNDDNDAVNPNTDDYMGTPYTPPGGGQSFDYDCSGFEQSDPSQIGLAPTCPALALGCMGSGYLPSGRGGAGVNVLCGSTTIRTCMPDGLGCLALTAQISEPHRCR